MKKEQDQSLKRNLIEDVTKTGRRKPANTVIKKRSNKMRSVRYGRSEGYIDDFRAYLDVELIKIEVDKNSEVYNAIISPLLDDFKVLWKKSIAKEQALESFELGGHGFVDEKGAFRCQGGDGEGCDNPEHILYPFFFDADLKKVYLLQLDHKKEQKIIGRYVVRNAQRLHSLGRTFDSAYLFELLIGKSNLQLVHADCHNRKDHLESICDAKAIAPMIFDLVHGGDAFSLMTSK